ncbi:nucleotidyltransferase domain-containing protein [Massilia sp. PWRC2]|uniref:nucleotidyltransferase domain-containing protein n=1 Tax=Massilia sp. PWRC2 TaxID=2804626 RepID=UPI003CF05A5B
MSRPLPLLVRVLRAPAALAPFSLADWDMILRQALAANLSAGLWAALDEAGVIDQVPAPARTHLAWARRLAERHANAVHWEVAQIAAALGKLAMPLILLKGAAYVASGAAAARGRLFSDIDILVPKEQLAEVEHALLMHGWRGGHHDEYDQRYYREWMHELPPMQHVKRQTMIDVHHAILPPTARHHPDPRLLRQAAVTVPADLPLILQTLDPVDMLLHSATHLFYDGETDKALRDMVDIDRMLRAFDADRWQRLAARAVVLELQRPLFYALRYAAWLFGTPVPAAVMAAATANGSPNAILRALMDGLFQRALLPDHASCDRTGTRASRWLLYVRGNWLRMPPLMLARHLFHKAFVTPKTTPAA